MLGNVMFYLLAFLNFILFWIEIFTLGIRMFINCAFYINHPICFDKKYIGILR